MGYFSTYTYLYLRIPTLSYMYLHRTTSTYIHTHLTTLAYIAIHVGNILTCRYTWDKTYIHLHNPTCKDFPYTNLHHPTSRTFDYMHLHPPTCSEIPYIRAHPLTCREMYDMYGNVDRCTNLHTCTHTHLHVGKGKNLPTRPYTPLQLLNTHTYTSVIFFTGLLILGGLLLSYL
jgi:hypothetical protein